ncbi:hypothetical protein CPB86DRAFT_421431 [Serendipita vermifera]|nr:hypothetical protein CPB86DRAFT_421431 [Serendipita vermifera]
MEPSSQKRISIYHNHSNSTSSRNPTKSSGTFSSLGDSQHNPSEVTSSYEMQEYPTTSIRDPSLDTSASSSRPQYPSSSDTRIRPSVPHLVIAGGIPKNATHSEVIDALTSSPVPLTSSTTQSTPAKSKRFSLQNLKSLSFSKKKELESPTPWTIPVLDAEEDPVPATHLEYFRYTNEKPLHIHTTTPSVHPHPRNVAHPVPINVHPHVSRDQKTLRIDGASERPTTTSTSNPRPRPSESPPRHVPQSAGPWSHQTSFSSFQVHAAPNPSRYTTRHPRPLPPLPALASRELQQPTDGPATA